MIIINKIKKTSIILIFFLFLNSVGFFSITSNASSDINESKTWNEDYQFNEEIIVPIDTSLPEAKYQPIDINYRFKNICWAEDENIHSIRILCWDGIDYYELESQIYNLSFKKEKILDNCNIVFLIPEFANGEERYFLYYDNESKDSPNYKNHVDVNDEYIFQEMMAGYNFESDFYEIKQEGQVIYAVVQSGESMGDKICQQIIKLKQNSKNFIPKNGEQIVSLACRYWCYDTCWHMISTDDKIVSKKILVDGNLMIKIGIISRSKNDELQTTCYYTYYYSPNAEKRIYANVKNEVLKPLRKGEETDLFHVMFGHGGIKSKTLKDLSFGGEIPSNLNVYNEDDRVLDYKINTHPESRSWKSAISKENDCDLGKESWISFDYETNNKEHGIIFDSNQILRSGEDEKQGIQLQQYETKNIELPGLDCSLIYTYLGRNTYESDLGDDNEIPNDYCAQFNLDFFSSTDKTSRSIEKEASIFKKLIKYHPKVVEDIKDDAESVAERYTLTTYLHRATSFPLGSILSTLFGKGFSYIQVELYELEKHVSTAFGSRLYFNEIPNILDKKPLDKIKLVFNAIDWNNCSFSKNVKFNNLLSGKYIIKVYRVNSIFSDEKKFIGYKIVDVQDDAETHVYCGVEKTIKVDILNNDNSGLSNASILVFDEKNLLIENFPSDSEGKTYVKIPFKKGRLYNLTVVYKGFLIGSEEIKLNYFDLLRSLKKTINIDTCNFNLEILDSNDKKPDFDIDIGLYSEEMIENNIILPDKETDSEFIFQNLIPAIYKIKINYKNYEVEEIVSILEESSKKIYLTDFKVTVYDKLNLKMDVNLDVILKSKNFYKNIITYPEKISKNIYVFKDLYPGEYSIQIRYDKYNVEKTVNISKNNVDLSIDHTAIFNIAIEVFDKTGLPLSDAEITIMRDGNKISKISDKNGIALFMIPPGKYNVTIYKSDEKIGQRFLQITNDEDFTIITKESSFNNNIMIISMIIFAFLILFSIKKKKIDLCARLIIVFILILSIIMPWWSLNGCENSYCTSTNGFLTSGKIVTLSSSSGYIGGEIGSTPSEFSMVLNVVMFLIFLSCLFIISNYFTKKRYKKISFILTFLPFFILLSCLLVFYYAIDQLTKIGIGSIFNSGQISIIVPGQVEEILISSSWGIGIGFYMVIICIILYSVLSYYIKKKMLDNIN